MFFILPAVLAVFLILSAITTGLRRPMSLERSGVFLLCTALFTALLFGAYRLVPDAPQLGALAKMMGEANYAFLIVFLHGLRRPLARKAQVRGSLLVVLVSLLHLALNLTLTGLWHLGVMSLQLLVLIGWLTCEAFWLWKKQPGPATLVLVLVTAAHGLAELAVRALLMLQSAPGDALAGQPGWSELSQDGLWMTFFLGFMTQMAVAAVVAQMLRRDKDQLALMLSRAQQMLQDKEHQLLNLMGARGTDAQPQLASLAHELRQPLGSIQLNAEYLASGERLSRDEEKQVLQDILRENHRAVAIVQGLRSLFDRSPPVRERIDLAQWLAHWVDRQAPVLLRQCRVQLRLQAQPGLVVRGNEAQLEMVLHNLVNNAVEAMASQAERQIDIALQREGLLAQLAVMDNGPGVDRSLQDKVFEMSYSTKAQGMGLGLWLSRRIVELHQGLLVCVPTPAGACMKISLPLESA